MGAETDKVDQLREVAETFNDQFDKLGWEAPWPLCAENHLNLTRPHLDSKPVKSSAVAEPP